MKKYSNIQFRKYYVTGFLCVLLSLEGCVQQPQVVQSLAPFSNLEVAPQLSNYTKFNIASQVDSFNKIWDVEGSVTFNNRGTFFEVKLPNGQSSGLLFVEPNVCKDDPNINCQRNFLISGQISAYETKLKCFISIRNDTLVSYPNQSLIGTCQDGYGRISKITLYSI
jgi:hypothetical protein